MFSRHPEVPQEARFFGRFERSLLLLSFLAAMWFVVQGGLDLYWVHASRSWPTVSGRVVYSLAAATETSRRTSRVRHSFTPYVHYAYRVEDQDHIGTRIAMDGNGYGEAYSRATVARYPEGATVQVAYDPGSPQRSCLEPGANRGSAGWWFFAGFLIWLCGSAIALLRALSPRPSVWRPRKPDPEIISLGLDVPPSRPPSS
jgi:hypothetical protein